MAIGFMWFLANLAMGLTLLQLLSIWIGPNAFGRALGFMLQGVSG